MLLPPLTAPLLVGAGAMQPPRAVRFSDNSNARLWLEVEWIVALFRYRSLWSALLSEPRC